MKKLLLIIIVLLLANTISYGDGIDAYIEILKSDARAQKVAVITEAMQLTDEESSAFWPVHREYEIELDEIIDDRIELIKDYFQNYDNLTDEKARKLAQESVYIGKKKNKIKEKVFQKI